MPVLTPVDKVAASEHIPGLRMVAYSGYGATRKEVTDGKRGSC